MTECYECKSPLSSLAPACPHCGAPKTLVDSSGRPFPSDKTTNWWGWLKSISAIVASLAAASVPIVVAFIGHGYTKAIKDNDRNSQLVAMAIGVLTEEPSDVNRPLRQWAVRTLNQSSDPALRLTDEESLALIETTALPQVARAVRAPFPRFDAESIMLYPIPPALLSQKDSVPDDTKAQLSEKDKEFIDELYGGNKDAANDKDAKQSPSD